MKPVDGEFGPLTRVAVVRYQKVKHQKATGVVTSAVWRALSADARPKPKPAPKPKPKPNPRRSRRPQPAPKPAPKVTGKYGAYDKVVLKQGSNGPAVEVLQTALWISPADGDSARRPRRSWSPTSRARSFPPTGVVTSPVWRALSADALHPLPRPATSFTLTGSGFGHGVGMSQYGAYAQALAGRSANDIVRSYYPGTTRSTIKPGTTLRVNLLAGASTVTLHVGATGAANGAVVGRVTAGTGAAPRSCRSP